jgi:predicted amino acid-binding ACT domain protein
VTVWFTVQLEDRPGSLAEVAAALAARQVNITGIVGVAEDTEGALMLTTSDAARTRAALADLGLAFEEHDPSGGLVAERMSARMSDLDRGPSRAGPDAGRGSGR